MTLYEAGEILDLAAHEVVAFPIYGVVIDMVRDLDEQAENILYHPNEWNENHIEAAKVWLAGTPDEKYGVAEKLVEIWDMQTERMLLDLEERTE